MPAFLVIQFLLFCLAGMLAVQCARAGTRANLGQFLVHSGGALFVLIAIVTEWHSANALMLQGVAVVVPYLLGTGLQLGIQRALAGSDYQRALHLARMRMAFFPFDVHRREVTLLEALVERVTIAGAHSAPTTQAVVELAEEPGYEPLSQHAVLTDLRHRAARHDWAGIIQQTGRVEKLPPGPHEATALCLLARAHCEQKTLTPALEVLARLDNHPDWFQVRHALRSAWLAALALGGRVRAVETLLKDHFNRLDPMVKTAWRVRASWAAGDQAGANAALDELVGNLALPPAVRSNLEAQREKLADALTPIEGGQREALDRLERLVDIDRLILPSVLGTLLRPGVVSFLMVVLLGVMAGTHIVANGADSLARFGAMGTLWRLEPWRFFSALFLHEGGTHLLLDVLAMGVLGGTVERALGKGDTLAIWGISGLAAAVVSSLLHPASLMVASSGAILGWFGALVAVLLRARPILPSAWAREALQRVALFVGLELALGLLAPHISLLGDLAAIGVGLGAGAAMGRTKFVRSTEPEDL